MGNTKREDYIHFNLDRLPLNALEKITESVIFLMAHQIKPTDEFNKKHIVYVREIAIDHGRLMVEKIVLRDLIT